MLSKREPGDGTIQPVGDVDPVALLLADKRSPQTKRAYAADLRAFFGTGSDEPVPDQVRAFVGLSPPEIALELARYKGRMLESGAAEATINRRLAAVRSLLKFCHRLGFSSTDGRGLVDGEKAQTYRDTRGIDLPMLKKLLRLPGKEAGLKGLRDAALLRLLAENALRRAEVCSLEVADLDAPRKRVFVLGKGRGTQKEPEDISPKLVTVTLEYLRAAGHTAGALFRNVDHRPEHAGEGITPAGIYDVVGEYGRKLGIRLTPHQLRHTAITLALDAGFSHREVQDLSRHKDIRTLQLYDDNRQAFQGKVSRKLSGLIG